MNHPCPSKMNPLSLKMNPLSLKMNPLSLKMNPLSLKMNPLSLKMNPLSLKMNPLSLKMNPLSLKMNPLSLKMRNPFAPVKSKQQLFAQSLFLRAHRCTCHLVPKICEFICSFMTSVVPMGWLALGNPRKGISAYLSGRIVIWSKQVAIPPHIAYLESKWPLFWYCFWLEKTFWRQSQGQRGSR